MADDFTVGLTYEGSGNASRYADSISTLFGVSVAKVGEKTELVSSVSEENLTGVNTAALFTIVHNRDATNYVRVRVADTAGHTYDTKLLPGQFHVINGTEINVSATEAAFASFSTIDSVKGQADTADCMVSVITVYS